MGENAPHTQGLIQPQRTGHTMGSESMDTFLSADTLTDFAALILDTAHELHTDPDKRLDWITKEWHSPDKQTVREWLR